jgi:hypothetical protein
MIDRPLRFFLFSSHESFCFSPPTNRPSIRFPSICFAYSTVFYTLTFYSVSNMSSPKTPPRTRSHEEVEDPAVRPEDGPIEPDTDSDSSYSKSTGVTDTESLKSSIMEYKWVHGRRFHAYGDGTYWGANDDRQQEAEDLMQVTISDCHG